MSNAAVPFAAGFVTALLAASLCRRRRREAPSRGLPLSHTFLFLSLAIAVSPFAHLWACSSAFDIGRATTFLSPEEEGAPLPTHPSVVRHTHGRSSSRSGRRRRRRRGLAIATFVSEYDELYGVYSISTQLAKFNMTAGRRDDENDEGVTQIVLISKDATDRMGRPLVTRTKLLHSLSEWVGSGEGNVRIVDTAPIQSRIGDTRTRKRGLWRGTFNKLLVFNLTQYDKVIMLDGDVLVRRNLMHWFEYEPTPCGIQAKDDVSWNSGAMLIDPNEKVFEEMLRVLPNVTSWQPRNGPTGGGGSDAPERDTWSTGYSDQDFLTAYFARRDDADGGELTTEPRRCVMPTESAVLSSSLESTEFEYFYLFRNYLFETVHFTTDKPWRRETHPTHPAVCAMLREWKESVQGIERYAMRVENDFLRSCPPPTLLKVRTT